MSPRVRSVLASLGLGSLVALVALGLLVVGQLLLGTALGPALWFARRAVLALGAVGILVSGGGYLLADPHRGDAFSERTGLSWEVALIIGSVGALLVGTAVDLLVISL